MQGERMHDEEAVEGKHGCGQQAVSEHVALTRPIAKECGMLS